MICPKCQFQNPEGIKICQSCKISLSRKINLWKIGFLTELVVVILLTALALKQRVVTLNSSRLASVFESANTSASLPSSLPTPKSSIPINFTPFASWLTYSNQKLNIEFKHPPEWEIRESDANSVRVTYKDQNSECRMMRIVSELTENCNYMAFYVAEEGWGSDIAAKYKTSDANIFLLNLQLDEQRRIEEDCNPKDPQSDCMGAIPGPPFYHGPAYFFDNLGVRVAQGGTMPRAGGDYQYFAINHGKVYLIEMVDPYNLRPNPPNDTLKLIAGSLKFLD